MYNYDGSDLDGANLDSLDKIDFMAEVSYISVYYIADIDEAFESEDGEMSREFSTGLQPVSGKVINSRIDRHDASCSVLARHTGN